MVVLERMTKLKALVRLQGQGKEFFLYFYVQTKLKQVHTQKSENFISILYEKIGPGAWFNLNFNLESVALYYLGTTDRRCQRYNSPGVQCSTNSSLYEIGNLASILIYYYDAQLGLSHHSLHTRENSSCIHKQNVQDNLPMHAHPYFSFNHEFIQISIFRIFQYSQISHF